jgi:PAS domain S-box-containing protein
MTKEQLESENLSLINEIETLRKSIKSGPGENQRKFSEILHNLQVHQEELRTQNEELRQAQVNVEQIGQRYRDLFEYSPVGYFIIDDNYAVLDANIAGMGMLGRTKGRIAGKPFLLFVEKSSRQDLDAHFAEVKALRRSSTELWLTPDQGPAFPVILESVQLGDGWGGGWRCLTTAMNITDRKRAELALQESETRFRAIFEQSPLAMQIVDRQSLSRMTNRAWVKLWGDEARAASPQAVLSKIGAEEQLAEGFAGRSVEFPPVLVAGEGDKGEDRWVHGYLYPIRQQGVPITEVALVNEDVTDRKNIELALAERGESLSRQYENLRVLSEISALPPSNSAQRLSEALALARQHLDLSMGMIGRIDGNRLTIEHHSTSPATEIADGTSFDLGGTYCTLAMEQGDVVAITHMALSPYADHPCYRLHGLESYIGAPIYVGASLYGAVSFSSLTPNHRQFDDGDKELLRLLARWIASVLEEDAIRRELARSNIELEQFAYVASHDLRQPLRQISGYVSLLERRYSDKLDAEAHEFIAFARDGATRMDRLIADLLEFSRIGRNAKPVAPVQLGETVNEAIANLSASISETNGRVQVINPLPMVTGNAMDLTRLFQNLIGNAIKYRMEERSPEVIISTEAKAMSHVITVSDNGIGIEPDYFSTIFGVFKRLHTAEKYEGSGIGLAICKKIIDQHNGRIWVDSQIGKGTSFHVELPRGL